MFYKYTDIRMFDVSPRYGKILAVRVADAARSVEFFKLAPDNTGASIHS